jgi:hypothetical protein
VQTFTRSPFPHPKADHLTFASSDTVTVADDFDTVFRIFTG